MLIQPLLIKSQRHPAGLRDSATPQQALHENMMACLGWPTIEPNLGADGADIQQFDIKASAASPPYATVVYIRKRLYASRAQSAWGA